MGKRDVEMGAAARGYPAGVGPPPPAIVHPPGIMRPPPPEHWLPWLIPVIFLANVGMFAYSLYINNCPASSGGDRCLFQSYLGRFSFQPVAENPLLGPSAATLEQLGALELKQVLGGQRWRLFTCMWLHLGVIHLLINMLSLLFVGTRLEQEFGFLKIGTLYGLSGLGGSIASALRLSATQRSISVGASGALFGLLGAMLSELFINWTIYTHKCSTLTNLMIITIMNLALGFLPGVDAFAHFGGFMAGFFLGFILLLRPQYGYINHKYAPPGYVMQHKPRHNCCQYFMWITAVVIFCVGFLTAYSLLFNTKGIKEILMSQ